MKSLLQRPGVSSQRGIAPAYGLKAQAAADPGRVSTVLYFGLLIAFVFEYVRPGTYVPLVNALKMNTAVPLAVFAFTALTHRRLNSALLRETNTKWLIFFLFLIAGSILIADVTFYSWFRFKQIIGYYVFFFLIFKAIDSTERMKGLFLVIVLIHIALAVLNPDLILHPESRPYIQNVTFLGDGNDFGLSVCIAIPMALFLIQDSSGMTKKIFFSLLLLVLILCVVGTSSRGASLALASVLLYQWVKSRRKLLGIALLAAVGVAVLLYAPATYFERMETIKNFETEGSAKGRLMAWGSSLRMAADNPLMGVGAGHFPVKYGTEYRPEGIGRADLPWQTAHSIYFLILGELGIPGIIFLLYVILSNLFRNEKRMKALGAIGPDEMSKRRLLVCLNSSLIAFAVGGAFLSAVYYPHLYVILGLFTAVGFHMAAGGTPAAPFAGRRI